jgi:anti-anti-sigma factor
MHPGEAEIGKADGSFTISSQRLEQGIVVAPAGDVDLATAPIVEDELRRAEESEEVIVLDLAQVSFMDSTGLRMVITADQRARDRGGTLRIVHVPAPVRRLFDLVGIAERLEIVDVLDGRPDVAGAA